MIAGAPSPARDVASHRISLVRTGEGPDVTWLAEIEELPNCSARGATPEEAVRRVWDAAEGRLGQAKEREGGGDGKQPTTAARHSGKLLVRMPATLHDELARAAESEGVSLNQLITGALAGAVEWRTTGEHAPPTKGIAAASDPSAGDHRLSGRLARVALAANFAVVLVAAMIAITLLVVAWRDGF